MASPGGRRLRPLAVLCALLMVAWGVVSAVALVQQIAELNDLGWPDENADGEVFAWIWLYLLGAASGCWVGVWGLFGLGWRPPLHVAVLALLVAVGLEIGANAVQAGYIADQVDRTWSLGDQLGWYGDRVTFQADGLVGDQETRGFFIALPLVTAWIPLVAWLVVLVTGAGRKQRFAPYPQPYQQPYAQPYQQPYAQPYQQPFAQPYQQPYQQPYAQPYQQPYQQPPPAHAPQPHHPPQPVQEPPPEPPPPAERVPWQDVPPVLPRARPAPPRKPPDQQETQPYGRPNPGS